MLDDTFGVAFFAAKLGGGFTANLTVNYRKPLPAGRDVYVKATIDRIEESSASGSKKVFLVGSVVDAHDQSTVYTDAQALFIVKAVPSSNKLVESVHAAMDAHASASGTVSSPATGAIAASLPSSTANAELH